MVRILYKRGNRLQPELAFAALSIARGTVDSAQDLGLEGRGFETCSLPCFITLVSEVFGPCIHDSGCAWPVSAFLQDGESQAGARTRSLKGGSGALSTVLQTRV
jgi:hypothetical protein